MIGISTIAPSFHVLHRPCTALGPRHPTAYADAEDGGIDEPAAGKGQYPCLWCRMIAVMSEAIKRYETRTCPTYLQSVI